MTRTKPTGGDVPAWGGQSGVPGDIGGGSEAEFSLKSAPDGIFLGKNGFNCRENGWE